MNHLSLADNILISQDVAAQAASANVQGTVIDMQGWDGCLFEFNLGAFAAGATFQASIFSSPNANMTGNAVVTGTYLGAPVNATFAAPIANTSANNTFMIDVYRPTNRYLQDVTQPTGGNVSLAVSALRYRRNGLLPPTQTAQSVVRVQVN
jgi:hypothetical protein